MLITSTYLGKPDPKANAYVYLFWEDYSSDSDAPRRLVEYMRRAGNLFGEEASFFVAHQGDQEKISEEVNRGHLKGFRDEISKYAPCLLLTGKSLEKFSPAKDAHMFLSVPHRFARDKEYQDFFSELHRLVADKKNSRRDRPTAFLENLWNALSLSPNVMGLGIDLKKLVSGRDRSSK